MNPRLGLLSPYPFEKLRALFAGVTPDAAKRPISLSLGEPRHPTPRLIVEALDAAAGTFSNYPTTIGPPALREAIAAWLVRRHGLPSLDAGDAGAARARQPRGALLVCPDRARRLPSGRDGGGAQSVLPDLRRRGAARRRAHPLRQCDARQRLRARLRLSPCGGVGAHAVALRLLAGQSHRSRAHSRRVAHAVRAVGSPRLRDRLRRVLLGDLLRRGSSAARCACRGACRRPLPAIRDSWCSAAYPSAPTRPDCARATWRATRRCSKHSCSTARITAAPCRARWPRRASPPGTTRRTCAPTAPSTLPSSRRCIRA